MNKITAIIAIGSMLLLSACGTFTGERPLSERIARVEATYAAGLELIVNNREICVENPAAEDCIINDEVALEINPYIEGAGRALDKAATFVEVGDEEQARTLYNEAVEQLSGLRKYVDILKGLVS